MEVLRDAGTGHADAIALALRDERARAGALVVMADCPLVHAESLDALAAAARPLALAPSRDGGVNALALSAVNGFVPRFGVPLEETTRRGAGRRARSSGRRRPAPGPRRRPPEDYEAMLACL